MIHKPWTTNETQTHITLQKQVVVKPFGAAIATTAACICGVSLLSPRNSDGDDRAASPGWGEPAPSKPLNWRLGAHTTDHVCDPLSNRDISNGRSRRYLLEHVSALAQIAKPRTGSPSYREGLSLPFNQQDKRRILLNAKHQKQSKLK